MAKAIVVLFLASGLLYFLFYPFLKNKVNRKKTLRWFLIVYGGALLLSTINYYLSEDDEVPASFRQGVALVKQQSGMTARIGQFKALHYQDEDLPGPSDNPALIKFTLEGTKGSVNIEAEVAKDSRGDWYIVAVSKEAPGQP